MTYKTIFCSNTTVSWLIIHTSQIKYTLIEQSLTEIQQLGYAVTL